MEVQVTDDSETVVARTFSRAPLAGVVRELSAVDDLRMAWAIGRQWLVAAAAVAFVVYVDRWWAWVLGALVIASRQHALLVLMHEAAHFHMFRDRALGDVIADLFCAYPVGITTAGFRVQHAEHHRHTDTPGDPNWRHVRAHRSWHLPRSRLGMLGLFVGDTLGLFSGGHLRVIWPWTFAARLLGRATPAVTRGEVVRYGLWWILVGGFLTLTGGWWHYLLLWLLPALTFMMACFRVRALAEHPYTPAGPDELEETRHIDATWLERVFICPFHIQYHLAHHLFPSIPYYHLPAMHRRLEALGLYTWGVNRFDTYFRGERSALTYLARPRCPPPHDDPRPTGR